MNLIESVATLKNLLPLLNASDAAFASSLIASFTKYNNLTPKQAPWIGKLIDKATVKVATVPVAPLKLTDTTTPVNVGGFAGVIALFGAAKANGLKFPKITLSVMGKTIKLALLGAKSKHEGAVNITNGGKYPAGIWYGRVSPEGSFVGSMNNTPEFMDALTAILTALAKHPARVAKEHGKLSGLCCFCGTVVGDGEDKRSIAVGFGPVCAKRWGLKAEWLAGVAKAEAGVTEVPTLTASIASVDAATALATSLQALTGSVAVTVTDGPVTVTAGADAPAMDLTSPTLAEDAIPYVSPTSAVEDFVPVTLPPYDEIMAAAGVTCFLCGKATAAGAGELNGKVLHGHTVCAECVKQLA